MNKSQTKRDLTDRRIGERRQQTIPDKVERRASKDRRASTDRRQK